MAHMKNGLETVDKGNPPSYVLSVMSLLIQKHGLTNRDPPTSRLPPDSPDQKIYLASL